MPHASLDEELGAVQALAAKLSLGSVTAQLLKAAKHTSVRLSPLPLVARIAGTSPSEPSIALEVKIARSLASAGAPTVRPAKVAGPYIEHDCAITLWEFVQGRPHETEAELREAVAALKETHRALQGTVAALPSFTVGIDTCEPLLANPASLPKLQSSERSFLQDVFADLREELSRRTFGSRPLHGDAHLGNVLITAKGATWLDLEAVCTGPVEWDMAALPPHAWEAFSDADPDLVQLLSKLRRVCVATWCWADFHRSPEVMQAAAFHLKQLKAEHH